MAQHRARVGLDANVLVAGIRWPRWPHEVLRAALDGSFAPAVPEQVLEEARRHLPHPDQAAALDLFLAESNCERLAMPSVEAVQENLDLVRDASDVPIALALMLGNVEVFVTSDRDFTDPDATAARFRERIRVMLPAVFLREIIGWDSEALERVRRRTWEDIERDTAF